MGKSIKCPYCSGSGQITNKINSTSGNARSGYTTYTSVVTQECVACRGVGQVIETIHHTPKSRFKCSQCSGTGKIQLSRQIPDGFYPSGKPRPYKTIQESVKCPECNGKKEIIYEASSRVTHTPDFSSNKKGCFLTTATCNYKKLPDDCYELNTLRNFRDNWLINQPKGKDLIAQYYATAPLIVKKLNNEDMPYLWLNIKNCINLIEKNQNHEAFEIYLQLFETLCKEKQILR